MKEDKFFKVMPYPFFQEEEIKLKNKILSSLPEKRYNFFPKFAISFAIILILLAIPFFISNNGKGIQTEKKVIVPNPLKIKSEEIALQNLTFPMPEFEEKVEDIPFQITKINRSVKLVWQENQGQKYRIKKCTFLPPQKDCGYLGETDKNYFIDKNTETANLIIYIVEAVRG